MIRAAIAGLVALALIASPAHALRDEELAIARTFEGSWGVVRTSAAELDETAGLGCGEERAMTFRVEQDEWGAWRFYFHPDQRFTGAVVVGASDDGAVQRLTIEAFAPLGATTEIYERRGDRMRLRLGFAKRELKRC